MTTPDAKTDARPDARPDAKPDAKADLDTLIREAEARVVAADRQWQRHGDQLSVALRGHAGTAAKVGTWSGIGVAVAAVAGGLLRWRSASRARAKAKTVAGRAKGMAQGIAQTVAAKWAARPGQPPQTVTVPARRPNSTVWETVVTALGLLVGAAARSGLKTKAQQGVAPLLFTVGLPMLSRWWKSKQPPPR